MKQLILFAIVTGVMTALANESFGFDIRSLSWWILSLSLSIPLTVIYVLSDEKKNEKK